MRRLPHCKLSTRNVLLRQQWQLDGAALPPAMSMQGLVCVNYWHKHVIVTHAMYSVFLATDIQPTRLYIFKIHLFWCGWFEVTGTVSLIKFWLAVALENAPLATSSCIIKSGSVPLYFFSPLTLLCQSS